MLNSIVTAPYSYWTHSDILDPLASVLVQNQCTGVLEISDHCPFPRVQSLRQRTQVSLGKDGRKTDCINSQHIKILPQGDLATPSFKAESISWLKSWNWLIPCDPNLK